MGGSYIILKTMTLHSFHFQSGVTSCCSPSTCKTTINGETLSRKKREKRRSWVDWCFSSSSWSRISNIYIYIIGKLRTADGDEYKIRLIWIGWDISAYLCWCTWTHAMYVYIVTYCLPYFPIELDTSWPGIPIIFIYISLIINYEELIVIISKNVHIYDIC